MKRSTRRWRSLNDDRGMALIGVLVLSALLMGLCVTLALVVQSDTRLRGAFGSGVTGFYAAESGLNAGMGEYRNIFLDYNVPVAADYLPRTMTVGARSVTYKMTERAGNPENIVIPAGQIFTGLNAQQYRYIVNSTATNVNNDIEAGVGAEFLVGYIPLFQFVAFYKDDLEILPGANMVLNGRVHTNSNLYLNSDASLTIADNPAVGVTTVQVSAGQSIYRGRKNTTACNGTVTIDKLEDKVAPSSDLDPQDLPCSGGATRAIPQSEIATWKGSMIRDLGNIAIPEPDIIKPPAAVSNGGVGNPGVYWDKADLRIVLHANQLGGLPAVAAPIGTQLYVIDVVDSAGARDVAKTTALWNFMADGNWNNGAVGGRGPSSYRGTMPIFYTDVPAGGGCANGVPVCGNTNPANYAPTLFPAGLANRRNPLSPTAATAAYTEGMGTGASLTGGGGNYTFDKDYRRGGFYNWREGKWMLLLNINVRDLILWNGQNGSPFFSNTDNTEGGLVIYATIAGASSNNASNNYGVRVFGSADFSGMPAGIGANADPTGVTVVSDQAMYILGDFNRGTVPGGVPRQPASIIGDSVNVLSEAYWARTAACNTVNCRDGQSTLGLTSGPRDAVTTWICAAVLGGVDATTVGNYNGGLENYPRFHEDWGGTSLNYQGSFVSLGTTEHVNGNWCGTGTGCNIYNPPARLWNFDPGYNDAANLPPLTPRFVYVQQVLFTEDFK
ncbi:MAG: hypothetical protein ABI629_17460 [bacterium]